LIKGALELLAQIMSHFLFAGKTHQMPVGPTILEKAACAQEGDIESLKRQYQLSVLYVGIRSCTYQNRSTNNQTRQATIPKEQFRHSSI